jgi:hypothetical protein
MTSPPLTDQKPREDPTEGLRALVADLRALTVRLELKERTPDLQTTLQAAQERVCGARALVMLLSEHAELKRRFLERLLGPNLALVPNPTTECTRLEYGTEPERTVTMSQRISAPAPALPLDPLQSFLSRGIGSDASDTGTTDTIVDTPREAMQTIRLPNPTLKGGLAVLDTPAVESGEPSASVLECIEQADAWVFVLNADHSLCEASQALLRRLPERGARLEMVVENAETLSGEERIAARDRLMHTLRERCNIEAPRLTLIASAATESDEGNFWHGRFATFHSVMMLRGRERWLEGTRAMVLDALTKVGAEIDFELKSIAPGVRHARLRLGMKDLDGLRMRFSELGGPDPAFGGPGLGGAELRAPENAPVPEVKTAIPQTAEAIPQQSRLDWSGGSDPAAQEEAAAGQSPLALVAEAIAAMAPESASTEAAGPTTGASLAVPEMVAPRFDAMQAAAAKPEVSIVEAQSISSERPAAKIGAGAMEPAVTPVGSAVSPSALPAPAPALWTEPASVPVGKPEEKIRLKRGVSVHLTGSLKRLAPDARTAESGSFTLLKRIAWIALVIAFICLILWALAPRGFLFGQEPPAEWDYQRPTPALASHAVPAAPSDPAPDPPRPGFLPETTNAATPNISGTPAAKHTGTVRMPLPRPIPSDATAGVPQSAKRHHRHLLGLGKLWHWVRHPHAKGGQNTP